MFTWSSTSPGLVHHIVDTGAVHLGDNPSRHSTVMLKINVETIPNRKPPACNPAPPRRPAWYKAEEDHVDNYTARLEDML